MKKIARQIYLIWRKSRGDSRIKIGIIRRSDAGNITFQYIKESVRAASKYGFDCYPDFPDLNRVYTENVLEVFAQRLNNTDRSDILSYFDFWEIDPKYKNDKFYILAQTQGLLSTDNFEFLASFYLTKDLVFISEIAGISHYNIPASDLSVNDKLSWRLDPQNRYDDQAVQVLKDKKVLGYIKMVHNEVFHDKRADSLSITVKSIEKNGIVHRAFIKISATIK